MDVQGVPLSTACSMDMQRVSISTASSMDVQDVSLSTTGSMDVQGVCISFHLCKVFKMPDSLPSGQSCTRWKCHCRNQSNTEKRWPNPVPDFDTGFQNAYADDICLDADAQLWFLIYFRREKQAGDGFRMISLVLKGFRLIPYILSSWFF